MGQKAKLRIALVCTGLGIEKRGFEAFTESYFQALRHLAPHLDVTLFQGGGKKEDRRIIVPCLHRYSPLTRWMDLRPRRMDLRPRYILETRTFALCLYPLLRRGGYDIVHYNDLTMGSALYHLRRRLGGAFRLLYCNGSQALPVHYAHRCDYAQILTGPVYEDARATPSLAGRLFLIPYGIDGARFSPANRSFRSEVRHKLQIPEEGRVILSVGKLDRREKRMDYVIREVSSLGQSLYLIVAGQVSPDTPSLQQQADRLLPGRCRFVSWPHEQMPQLYAAGDVFTLASLAEGFGLVTVEAMMSGLPVIIHNGPVFQWLAEGSSVHCIDMAYPGALAQALAELPARPASSREEAMKRFSWEALLPQYEKMYERVLETTPELLPFPFKNKTLPESPRSRTLGSETKQ